MNKQIKDIFAMSTNVLDQLGRTGGVYRIVCRTVSMTDIGLYELPGTSEFSNLSLSGVGVLGNKLEP